MEAVTRRKIDQCLPLSQAVLSLFAILIAINVIRAMVGIYKCHTVSDWLADTLTFVRVPFNFKLTDLPAELSLEHLQC